MKPFDNCRFALVALLTLALSDCGAPDSSDRSEDAGEVILEMRSVPDHVNCFEFTAVGTHRVRRTFSIVGTPIVEHFQGMPTGTSISFEGAAYADASCLGSPTWVGDPISAAVVPAVPTTVHMTLRPNGVVNLEPSFVSDNDVPVVDQSVREPGGLIGFINEGCRYVGQTYTAGITGVLYGVAVDIQYAYFEVPLRVSLRKMVGNVPESTSLAEVTLATDSSPMDSFVLFPQTVRQTAGETFAIIVDYPSAPAAGPNQGAATWSGASPSPGDVYPGGGALCGQQNGVTWTYTAELTYHFETRVYPDQ